MIDDQDQEVLFEIEGPDEDGCVWACAPEGLDPWCQNLGPKDKVAETLARWLRTIQTDGASLTSEKPL